MSVMHLAAAPLVRSDDRYHQVLQLVKLPHRRRHGHVHVSVAFLPAVVFVDGPEKKLLVNTLHIVTLEYTRPISGNLPTPLPRH